MKMRQLLIMDLLLLLSEAGIFWGLIFKSDIFFKIFPYIYALSFLAITAFMLFPPLIYLFYIFYLTKDGITVFLTALRLLQIVIIVLTSFFVLLFGVNIADTPSEFAFVMLLIVAAIIFYKNLFAYTLGKEISSPLFFIILLYTLIVLSCAFWIFSHVGGW